MFEHYLSNKNKHATVTSNSNFLKLNAAWLVPFKFPDATYMHVSSKKLDRRRRWSASRVCVRLGRSFTNLGELEDWSWIGRLLTCISRIRLFLVRKTSLGSLDSFSWIGPSKTQEFHYMITWQFRTNHFNFIWKKAVAGKKSYVDLENLGWI